MPQKYPQLWHTKGLMQELSIKISLGLEQQTHIINFCKIKKKADRKGKAKQIVYMKITWTPLFQAEEVIT